MFFLFIFKCIHLSNEESWNHKMKRDFAMAVENQKSWKTRNQILWLVSHQLLGLLVSFPACSCRLSTWVQMPIKVLLLPQPNMIRHEVIGFMMPNLNPDHVSVSRREKKTPWWSQKFHMAAGKSHSSWSKFTREIIDKLNQQPGLHHVQQQRRLWPCTSLKLPCKLLTYMSATQKLLLGFKGEAKISYASENFLTGPNNWPDLT